MTDKAIIRNEANIELIKNLICEVRGLRMMLYRDLAELYGVETRVLNLAVKRNIERFPDDFLFQLNKSEWGFLRSQIVTLEKNLLCTNTEDVDVIKTV